MYREVLRLGEARGSIRAASSTPYEHRPSLEEVLEDTDSVSELTDAYVDARYAEEEPRPEDVTELRRRVERLRQRLTADDAASET